MTYKFTSVINILEGTNNGNKKNNISKKAQITYYLNPTASTLGTTEGKLAFSFKQKIAWGSKYF